MASSTRMTAESRCVRQINPLQACTVGYSDTEDSGRALDSTPLAVIIEPTFNGSKDKAPWCSRSFFLLRLTIAVFTYVPCPWLAPSAQAENSICYTCINSSDNRGVLACPRVSGNTQRIRVSDLFGILLPLHHGHGSSRAPVIPR